jgi:ABC-type phosphate/phosphonate transport system ATPase subunit
MNMHEVALVQEYCDQVLVMRRGRPLFEGRGNDVTWSLLREAMS